MSGPNGHLRMSKPEAVVTANRGGEASGVNSRAMKGHTISVITLPRNSIRPVEATDLIHVRRAAVG